MPQIGLDAVNFTLDSIWQFLGHNDIGIVYKVWFNNWLFVHLIWLENNQNILVTTRWMLNQHVCAGPDGFS